MAITRPCTPILLRFQSMIRYSRLWPPPRCRVVIRPLLLRPAVFLSGSVSAFSGRVLVISSKVDTDIPRRPGEVGLYVLTGMSSDALEQVEPLAGFQGHDGFLPGTRSTHTAAAAANFACHMQDVHVRDLNLLGGEGFFDGALDLYLVDVRRDFENVFALFAKHS